MDAVREERSATPQVLDADRDEDSNGDGGLETHRVQRAQVAPPTDLKRQFALVSDTLNSHLSSHSPLQAVSLGEPWPAGL